MSNDKKSPQPWNKNLDDQNTLFNHVYLDTDSTGKIVCARIKTQNVQTYINAIKSNLNNENLTQFLVDGDITTIDTNDPKIGKVKITLYPTGKILIQGGKPHILERKADLILQWHTTQRACHNETTQSLGPNSKEMAGSSKSEKTHDGNLP